MKRTRFNDLANWLQADDRRPLIIRGARQVGKTWLVRQLAEQFELELIEFNFEDRKQDVSLFRTNEPATTLQEIGAARDKSISPENSLLFLDEIQAAPELIPKLRWFAEKMPELALIATGSLLDFTLESYEMSMPVGRIQYLYLEPLSFEEFLQALHQESLCEYLNQYTLNQPVPESIHEKLTDFFKTYLLVGGLPAVVASWKSKQSLSAISEIQNNLLSTYRDDFGKYRGRMSKESLEDALMSVPRQLAQKFIFQSANPEKHSSQIKSALNLLEKARIIHRVDSCHANGLPLSAEVNAKNFKVIFLDVGLCSALLGLTLDTLASISELTLINSGGIAEQFVGQALRTNFPHYIDPALYCWMRATPGASSEVDYIIQHKNRVMPVEVKAGKTGSLKSLHYFMGKKQYPLAVRINSDYPSVVTVDIKDTSGKPVKYELLSMPFYLLGQLHRLLDHFNV